MALSYREKAQSLQQESARAWSAGKVDNARYETLSRFYADHLRLAGKELANWREDAAARGDQLQMEYAQLTRDLERLRREESAGRIASGPAADERARLNREIAWHGAAIAELQQLGKAETSVAAGGYLDLPLEAYGGKPGVPQAPGRRGWRWTWQAVVLLLAFGLVGFALLTALPLFTDSDWSLWGSKPPTLRCTFAFGQDQEKTLQVDCKNEGDRPINLYLPWPDALPPETGLDERSVGGIEVQLRSPEEEDYKTRPVPSDWWFQNGQPLNAGEAVVVEPLFTVQLVLDTAMVRSLGDNIAGIRLLVERGDGTVFDTYEASFSQPRTGRTPPTPRAAVVQGVPEAARRNVPAAASAAAPRAPAGPPSEAKPSSQPGQSVAPGAEEKPEAESEKPSEPPVFAYVSLVGNVGGKAALSFRLAQEERPRRVTVEVGDEIGGGWLVDALEEEARLVVVLSHPATGRTARVVQGAAEPVRLLEAKE